MITATYADRVLVFDGGRIVEAGDHGDLMGRGGIYAGLFAAWRHRPGGGGQPAGDVRTSWPQT
jgi:ABC-type transport system involved in cytochrome bd biosynthesis fused ATPase/permease subunit